MARVRTILNSFNSGEWSPELDGRVDLAKYRNSCKTLENAIALKEGGASRRPGTHFAAEVKTSAKHTRLIPFVFSTVQAYIIEVGDQYMRFYKDNGRIENPPGTPVEIVTTYLEADLFDLHFTQSADVLYITCQKYPPRRVTRTSHIAWAIIDVPFVATPAEWGAVNYPAAVTLIQQRSVWAGNVSDPDTLWFSKVGDYEDMTVGVGDGDGFKATLASNKVNAIDWLAPAQALLCGTSGQEWNISGGSEDDPVTPTSILAKAETTHGSNRVAPVQVHNAVLFLQRAGRKLREFAFDFNSNSFQAPDLMHYAKHIALGGITQMDYQQELNSIVWAIRADGTLLGLTYERPEDVVAWHRHITGPLQTLADGLFESIACIPTASEDQAWVVVKRKINGSFKRFVEYLDTSGGFYGNLQVDAGITYSGVAAATLSGLDHLNGETVDILGNGAVYPQQVVVGGQVTGLSPTVTRAEVGLHFVTTLKTQRPEAGAQDGTAQAAQKSLGEITVRLHESLGCTVNDDVIPFRKSSDPMGSPPALFSGDTSALNLGWDSDGFVTIMQNQPLPLVVIGIVAVMTVGD